MRTDVDVGDHVDTLRRSWASHGRFYMELSLRILFYGLFLQSVT